MRAGNHNLDSLRDRGMLTEGLRSSFIGVALAGNTEGSRRFITEFGPFDEIVVGRGWLNSAVVTYVWRDPDGSAGVPQLILVRRTVTVNERGINVSPDSLLFRLTGARAITSWAQSGAPLNL